MLRLQISQMLFQYLNYKLIISFYKEGNLKYLIDDINKNIRMK